MRKIQWSAVIIFIFLCLASELFAAGAATKYIITVQTIQLRNDSGEWVTIATPNQPINIADVDVGAVAGSFLNDASIPFGNYVNFKLIISETMTVAGSDGIHFTTANGSAVLTGNAATAADLDGMIPTLDEGGTETHNLAAKGDMTIQVNLDNSDADDYIEIYAAVDLGDPLVIKRGSVVSMWFDFDTAGTIHYVAADGWGAGSPASNAMYFTPPGAGTEFSITVDARTVAVTSANMTMAF